MGHALLLSLCFVLLLAGGFPAAHAASATQRLELVLTTSPLLPSTNLSACIVPSNITCVGGITAAAAYVRGWQREGRTVVYLPKLDHSSVFVQMAQSQLSVNIPVFERMGLRYYSVSSPVISDTRPANDGLLQTNVTLACGNAPTLPSNKWFGYTVRSYYDQRIVVIPLVDETQPFCETVIDAVKEAVVDAWRRHGAALDFTVVLHRSTSDPKSFADAVVQFATPPDIVLVEQPPAGFQLGLRNRTLFVQFEMADTVLTRLTLNYTYQGPGSQNPTIDACGVDTVTLAAIGKAYQDADYFDHRQFLRGLAAAALSNNPTLAMAGEPMPLTRLGEMNVCFAGSCPLGGMFTDAVRWLLGVDIAVETSGGLRGPGWPIGPIRVSDLWAALPFPNTLCSGRLLGLSIWEMFNRSLALATFTTQITSTGDRLLQVSGARIYYNPALDAAAGRITAIDVWDATTQQFKPLERLQLYSVAAHSFECNTFDTFPAFFSGRYRGEVKGRTVDTTIQMSVTQYLQALGAYTVPHVQRLVNTTNTISLGWAQSQSSCTPNTWYDAGVKSCIACPSGQYQPTPGQDFCLPQPQYNSALPVDWVLKVVPATVAAVIGLALIALGCALYRRRRGRRDLRNAPTEGPITLLFTDIQSSTKIWALAPESMARALDLHHHLIRDCIHRHKGYEVKTVGDSFMVALRSAQTGLALAVDIQLALQQQQFPRAIERVYRGDVKNIRDDPNDLAPLHPLWNGLRVRIGLHTGEPDCVFDPVSRGYDYYGPDVNTAARVEGLAQGGQILATESVVADVVVAKERMAIQYLGCASLRGLIQTVSVHQVMVPSLLQRSYYFENRWLSPPEEEVEMCASPSEAGTVVAVDVSLPDLLRQHPFVRQRVMGAEELEMAMGEVSEALTNAMRLLPSHTMDSLVTALAKSWRVREERTREETLQMVALRAMPSMPRYRRRVEANVSGRPLQPSYSRRSLTDPLPESPGVEDMQAAGSYAILLPNSLEDS